MMHRHGRVGRRAGRGGTVPPAPRYVDAGWELGCLRPGAHGCPDDQADRAHPRRGRGRLRCGGARPDPAHGFRARAPHHGAEDAPRDQGARGAARSSRQKHIAMWSSSHRPRRSG